MPHEDGAAYYPLVTTVSLGAPIVLDVYPKPNRELDQDQDQDQDQDDGDGGGKGKGKSEPQFRILQERRSLLVTRKRMYTDFLHGIAEIEKDEGLGREGICNWDLLRERGSFECGSYQRETRVSLTYRDVLKVVKLGNTMRFLGGR